MPAFERKAENTYLRKTGLAVIFQEFMGMNKNSIFAWASFFMLLIGIALVLLGVLKYRDYAIGFSTVGIGFFVMSWAFNALKGRV